MGDLNLIFYDDVGMLPFTLYELRRLEENKYILKDLPLSIRESLVCYEYSRSCKLCYLYQDLKEQEQKVYSSLKVVLESNKNGTYSFKKADKVKRK